MKRWCCCRAYTFAEDRPISTVATDVLAGRVRFDDARPATDRP